ncbi:Dihydrofolate reductase [Lachnellula suecica]|uniref:Dihydrofolate reductase n=1 Tax=Lachnellula suecica TaxID=602035 RepID=A0A8T9C1F7_9HELO|nr:Dihydrofolate reductase [Lachnellula suecica]
MEGSLTRVDSGNAQSGPYFEIKTRFIQDLLQKALPTDKFPGGVEMFYPTAPHLVWPSTPLSDDESDDFSFEEKGSQQQTWTWGFTGDHQRDRIERWEDSIWYLLDVIKESGPFDGIVAFSLGAAVALTLLSLTEGKASEEVMGALGLDLTDLPPRFKFAICCSGFVFKHPFYDSLYAPKIKTPTLHFVSAWDPVILENLTLRAAARCSMSRLVYHPGSHFVPRGRFAQKAMLEFVMEHTLS